MGEACPLVYVCQRAIFAKRTFEHTNGKTGKNPSTIGLVRAAKINIRRCTSIPVYQESGPRFLAVYWYPRRRTGILVHMTESVGSVRVVPAAAIEAAAEALLSAWNANDGEPERFEARHSAEVALEAAAPHIAAAERERIAGLAEDRGAFYLTEREIHPGRGPEPVAMGFAELIRVPDAEA